MARPSPEARAALDGYIQILASLGDGLTLDDFRSAQIAQAQKTAERVRQIILVASGIFMFIALAVLVWQTQVKPDDSRYDMLSAALWALALGGLGVVANVFLHMLKLLPQDTLRATDAFEVIARLALGCLFSTILAVTLAPEEMTAFFGSLHNGKGLKSDVRLLFPFLAGYSIPLVLGLLEKSIRAVELTIGLDDRREATPRRPGRRGRG